MSLDPTQEEADRIAKLPVEDRPIPFCLEIPPNTPPQELFQIIEEALKKPLPDEEAK